jgi:hypothetical protein
VGGARAAGSLPRTRLSCRTGPATDLLSRLAGTRAGCSHLIGVSRFQWVNNPTLTEFCFGMIGRADIEGSKSNVAMNAWLPQASYPCGHRFRPDVRLRTGSTISQVPSREHPLPSESVDCIRALAGLQDLAADRPRARALLPPPGRYPRCCARPFGRPRWPGPQEISPQFDSVAGGPPGPRLADLDSSARFESHHGSNFSGTSSLKFRGTKGSIGHAFTVCIHTENQNQGDFCPFALLEISVLHESPLGHLRYGLTDVPPQPNSPPDNVFNPDRPAKDLNARNWAVKPSSASLNK